MRIKAEEHLLQNLQGKWPADSLYYVPKDQALAELRKITRANFGYDVAAWKAWLKSRARDKKAEKAKRRRHH